MNKELEKLQGTWDITSLETEGKRMGENAIRGSQIQVRGNTFETVSMGATYKGRLEVDTTKDPKWLDLLFDEGPEKGNRSLAIYEIEGDRWRICLGLTGKKRPTAFATKAGSGHALETLVRHTGPSRRDALRDEIALLEGEWSMVSGEKDGQVLPKVFTASGSRTSEGNLTTVRFGGQVYLRAAFSLDPSKNPKTIDYLLIDGPDLGEYQYGIYEIAGDEVKFCFAPPGRPRPASFTSGTTGGGTLAVWRRRRATVKA